jgi:hypothetical protein
MADRRRERRYRLNEPAGGSLRIFPDVVVQQSGGDEWIALSREAALTGETLVLDVVLTDVDTMEMRQRFPVYVIDSQPVIVDGDVRHRIRLQGGDLAPILFEQQVRRG